MSSSSRFPRYLTYQPGEREALLKERPGFSSAEPPVYELSRNGLVKAHVFAVRFPDRTEGVCRYERRGPSFHLFHYTYQDGGNFPSQWCSDRIASYLPTIEAKGKELADPGFYRACNEECDRYFKRASLPGDGSRSAHPERNQMTASRARELAGRYALCLRVGRRLIATSAIFATLREANAAWNEKRDTSLVVACCNRLDRCWQVPKYNPLYAEFDPRREGFGFEMGGALWSSWK